MIHLYSALEKCEHCHERALCAELWLFKPPRRVYLCEGCLRTIAGAVAQAAARIAERVPA